MATASLQVIEVRLSTIPPCFPRLADTTLRPQTSPKCVDFSKIARARRVENRLLTTEREQFDHFIVVKNPDTGQESDRFSTVRDVAFVTGEENVTAVPIGCVEMARVLVATHEFHQTGIHV